MFENLIFNILSDHIVLNIYFVSLTFGPICGGIGCPIFSNPTYKQGKEMFSMFLIKYMCMYVCVVELSITEN